MAIIDAQTLFCDGQVITGTAATVSTNVLDLTPLATGNLGRNLSVGEDLFLQVNVGSVTGTSPTTSIAIQTDNTEAFSTPVVLATLPTTSLAATGNVILARLPVGLYEAYLRLSITQGGTSPVGTYKAALVRGAQLQTQYADAVAISA